MPAYYIEDETSRCIVGVRFDTHLTDHVSVSVYIKQKSYVLLFSAIICQSHI